MPNPKTSQPRPGPCYFPEAPLLFPHMLQIWVGMCPETDPSSNPPPPLSRPLISHYLAYLSRTVLNTPLGDPPLGNGLFGIATDGPRQRPMLCYSIRIFRVPSAFPPEHLPRNRSPIMQMRSVGPRGCSAQAAMLTEGRDEGVGKGLRGGGSSCLKGGPRGLSVQRPGGDIVGKGRDETRGPSGRDPTCCHVVVKDRVGL